MLSGQDRNSRDIFFVVRLKNWSLTKTASAYVMSVPPMQKVLQYRAA